MAHEADIAARGFRHQRGRLAAGVAERQRPGDVGHHPGFRRSQGLAQGRGDQGGHGRIGGAGGVDDDLLDGHPRPGAVVIGRHAQQSAPGAGVDVAGAALDGGEDQVVVAAHEQGPVRDQRQDHLVGGQARVAEHDQRSAIAERGLGQVGGGPGGGDWNVQGRADADGVGIEGIGGQAQHMHWAANVKGGAGRRRQHAAARVGDVAEHGDAEAAGADDGLVLIVDEIGLVIAQIKHHGGEFCQRLQEGPVERTAGALGDHIAMLEHVAVEQDQAWRTVAMHDPAHGFEQGGHAAVGGMDVRQHQDAQTGRCRQGRRGQHGQAGGGGQGEYPAAGRGAQTGGLQIGRHGSSLADADTAV
ncbi:MAG: hypothetical protein WDN45_12015 [Caulobacteraceae bacterium]